MLALGQWFIDKKTAKIFEQNNENQELELSSQAVKLLIVLAENQDKLMAKEQLKVKLWPDSQSTQQSQIDNQLHQLTKDITQLLGNNIITVTPDQYYLLQLPTFSYQYTPITAAQMKQQLAQKQLAAIKQPTAQSTTQYTAVSEKHQSNDNKTPALTQKLIWIFILALLIGAFIAAS